MSGSSVQIAIDGFSQIKAAAVQVEMNDGELNLSNKTRSGSYN